jgi:hypothetical protein
MLISSLLQITLLTANVLVDLLGLDKQGQAMEKRGEARRKSWPGP